MGRRQVGTRRKNKKSVHLEHGCPYEDSLSSRCLLGFHSIVFARGVDGVEGRKRPRAGFFLRMRSKRSDQITISEGKCFHNEASR